MPATELAPGLRQLRQAAAQRAHNGRAAAIAALEAVWCFRCDRPTVRGGWTCTCRPEPDWKARDAAALMFGRAA